MMKYKREDYEFKKESKSQDYMKKCSFCFKQVGKRQGERTPNHCSMKCYTLSKAHPGGI